MSVDLSEPEGQRAHQLDAGSLIGLATAPPVPWERLKAVAGRSKRPLLRALRAHSLFALLILLHALAAILLPPALGVEESYSLNYYGMTFVALTGIAFAAFLATYVLVVLVFMRPEKPWQHISRELRTLVTLERVGTAVPLLVLFPVFAATFSYFKVIIPDLKPFEWDAAFAAWDELLHGGTHPWQLLQHVLGHPYITTLINAGYHLWFGITYGVVLWLMVDTRRPRLRMRYLLTFLLLWIVVGNLAATLLSSAGPVYYGQVTGLADPYAPLMSYLHAASDVSPVPALDVQALLWHWYDKGVIVPGAGISAMPSLHVAVAFSFVLLAHAYDRRLALAAAAFTLLILIGSVHLGWHYAIDGYVSIIMTWSIWHIVGWVLRRPMVTWLLWEVAEDGSNPRPAPRASNSTS